ncbi:MAG TPA: imelysin family protein [Xanthobacteraceae bacterium]|nr:imelysin family protein [Xanthobacteraceae bacterium]
MARRFAMRLAAMIVTCGLWIAPVAAAPPVFDSLGIVEQWLLPAYDRLADDTAAQQSAWSAFCAAPQAAAVPGLQAAFDAAADDWNAIEFVTFGPVMLSLRADRFNLFPDRRNGVERAIAEVLAAEDFDARVAPERFARSSAAVQGLPALERLLYGEGAADKLLAGVPEAARRCALGRAIAGNLAAIARDIRAGWGSRSEGLLAQLAAGRADPVFFPDPAALPSLIVTDLAGAYQRAVDTRLLPVLGTGPDEARPQLGERWRSGRSGHVVAVMVGSANALVGRIAAALPSRPQAVVEKARAGAQAAAAALPADLAPAVADPAARVRLDAAVKAFKVVQRAVYRPIATYYGIPLGFNALDGD